MVDFSSEQTFNMFLLLFISATIWKSEGSVIKTVESTTSKTQTLFVGNTTQTVFVRSTTNTVDGRSTTETVDGRSTTNTVDRTLDDGRTTQAVDKTLNGESTVDVVGGSLDGRSTAHTLDNGLMSKTVSEIKEVLTTTGNGTMGWTTDITTIRDAEFQNATGQNTTSGTNKGLVSAETYNQALQITQQIWLPLCSVGLITNILNVVVFVDKNMRNTATSVYLVGISLLQITYFIVTSTRRIPSLLYGESEYAKTKFFFISVIYLSNYLGGMLTRTVYCLVMLVAFERMMAILFPIKLAKTRLVKSPIICVLCLIFVSTTFHIYLAMNFYVSEKIEASGTTTYSLTRTQFDPVILNHFSLAAKIIFVYAPLTLLFVFNVVLCVALKRSFKTRKSLQESRNGTKQEKREHQTTIAILVSTCIFFVLSLPMTTNSVVANLVPGYTYFGENRYTFLFVQEIGGLLNIVSYCVDFVTYVVISSKYRLTLLNKCLPCRYQKKSKGQSTEVSMRSVSNG